MGFLGKKPSQSTTPTRLNSIQINQSAYGNCIPLLYGTDRLPFTLIDYDDFQAQPVSQDAGGKGGAPKSVSSYDYSASMIMSVCEGPITGVNAVLVGQSVTTLGAQNMVLFAGAGSQAPWTYMVQHHPERALGYDHTSYVAAANYALGSNAGLPNITYEVAGLKLWNGGPDAHPADVLPDYCTDPNHGVGFPYLASLEGTNSFRDYCTAMGFIYSPCEATQRAAKDFIQETLEITNSNAVWSPGVGLRVVPYADQAVSGNGATYAPDLAPIYAFFDDDFTAEKGGAPITTSITPANETFNCWRVEFLDRANQYNTAIAEYRDELDIAINGLRVASTVSLHSIKTRAVALLVAVLLCNRNLYIRATFVFKVRGDFCLLEPMDLIALNDSTQGIVNQLVRITDIEDAADDQLTITAEEMVVGPASAPLYNTQLAQAFAQNYLVDPGPVAAPYIFTFPPALAGPDTNGYELGIAVGGTTGLWGGAEIWASMDNVTYWRVGAVDAPSRYGILANTLAAGSDPDTSNTASVQLNAATSLVMRSGTRADADGMRTPCLLGGEVISYQTAQALGGNAFALTYLRRGKYGSGPPVQHLAGAPFTVIDQDIFRMKFDPGYAGQPVWFKFVSFNYFGGGPQTLATATAYQGFFQGQNNGVLEAPGAVSLRARGNCVVTGGKIFKSGGAAAFDSDCSSVDAFSGGCVLKYQTCQLNANIMMGLNSDPLTDQNYTGLDYAWYTTVNDTRAYIYENGAFVAAAAVYTTSTVFEIRYDGKFVTYYMDGVRWWTTAAPNKTLFFDSSFYTPGAAVQNVYFGALNPATSSPFTARGQCFVSDENAQKVGGVDGWDSDIYSFEGYPTAHVSWKANQTNAYLIIGLGSVPGRNSSYESIEFALECQNNGTLVIQEAGTTVSIGAPTYSTSDVFAILYDGTLVTYLKNNVVLHTTVAASRIVPGSPLFMDSSFFTPGAGVNTLQFGPTTQLQLADTSQINVNAATDTYNLGLNGSGSATIPAGAAAGTPAAPGGPTLVISNPPKYPCNVVLTVNLKADIFTPASTDGDCTLTGFLFDTNTLVWQLGNVAVPLNMNTAPTSVPHSTITVRWIFAYNGSGNQLSIGTQYSNLTGSSKQVVFSAQTLQVEFIKR